MPYDPTKAIPGMSDARNFYLTHPRQYVTEPGGAFDPSGTRQVLDPNPRANPEYQAPPEPIPYGTPQTPVLPPNPVPPQPPAAPPEPPGESVGRNYGTFRKISTKGGPELRPSNTAELIRRAAARRLGLD